MRSRGSASKKSAPKSSRPKIKPRASAQRIERALRESEQKYRMLVENIDEIVYQVKFGSDPLRSAVDFVSPHVETVLGVSPNEFVSDPALWLSLLHPDDAHVVDAAVQRMIDTKSAAMAEYRMRNRATGEFRWIEDRGLPILDDHDRVVGYGGAARDVTERRHMQAMLYESEERFRKLSEAAFEGIIIHDRGLILAANPAMAKMFEFESVADLIGQNGLEILPLTPDSKDLIRESLGQRSDRVSELTVIRKDGSTYPAETQGRDILYMGRSARVVAMRDISQRKAAEEALRESEAKYRALIEQAGDGVIVVDVNGIIELVNQAMCRMLGYTEAELLRSNVSITYPPGEANMLTRRLRQVTERGALKFERVMIRKDGTAFPMEAVLGLTPSGSIQGIVRDISQRKSAEEAIRQSEQRYRALAEASRDLIFVLNREYEVEYANEVAAQFLQRSPEQMLGQKMEDLFAPEIGERQRTAVMKVIETGQPLYAETIFKFARGEVWLGTWLSPLFDSDHRVYAVLGASRDITERKRVEDLVQKSEAKYRALVERIPAVVYQSNAAKTIFVNPQIEALLGYTAEEWMADPDLWRNRLHPADRERVLDASRDVAGTAAPFEIEYRLQARDGREIWIYDKADMVRDSQGQPLFYQGVMFDITDRKRAEEEIFKHVNELSALHQASEQLLKLLDPEALAAQIIVLLEKTLAYEYGAVLLLDEPSGRLYPFAIAGSEHGEQFVRQEKELINRHRPGLGKGITGWVAEHGQSVRIGDVQQDERYYGLRSEIRSEMCSPLRAGDQMIGVINVESTRANAYSEDDLRLLETIAAQVSIAIKNANLMQEAKSGRDRLAELSRNLVEVHETEQRAIGRELHDQFGQMLTALKLTMEMAAQLPVEQARPKMKQAEEIVNDLLARVSSLSLELRPPMLDDLGLIPALLWHAHRYQDQLGIRVDVRHSGVEGQRFDSRIESTAYRVVQEALTNAARHARASEVRLQVHAHDGWLELNIEDNGQGFDPQEALARKQSSGLSGMRERAGLVNGTFHIASAAGEGTQVVIQLPL